MLLNTSSIHVSPYFINSVHNYLFSYFNKSQVIVSSQPFPITTKQSSYVDVALGMVVCNYIVIAWSFISAYFTTYAVKEKEVKLTLKNRQD